MSRKVLVFENEEEIQKVIGEAFLGRSILEDLDNLFGALKDHELKKVTEFEATIEQWDINVLQTIIPIPESDDIFDVGEKVLVFVAKQEDK